MTAIKKMKITFTEIKQTVSLTAMKKSVMAAIKEKIISEFEMNYLIKELKSKFNSDVTTKN